jgi:hypothetical protein
MADYKPVIFGVQIRLSILSTAVLGWSDSESLFPRPLPREPLDLFRYSVDLTRKRAQSINTSVEPLKDLTGHVDRDELQFIGGGTFGDVYRGKWTDAAEKSQSEIEIVVKVLRSTGAADSKSFVKDLKVA